nr:hypothetical protein [Embleya scabrispora]
MAAAVHDAVARDLADAAEHACAVALRPVLPDRDDPSRVAAHPLHVDPGHPVGVGAQFVAQRAGPRFDHRDADRLVGGQAGPNVARGVLDESSMPA